MTDSNAPAEQSLWDLVDEWRDLALKPQRAPYLNPDPGVAFCQAMNFAAEQLSDLLLDSDGDA